MSSVTRESILSKALLTASLGGSEEREGMSRPRRGPMETTSPTPPAEDSQTMIVGSFAYGGSDLEPVVKRVARGEVVLVLCRPLHVDGEALTVGRLVKI